MTGDSKARRKRPIGRAIQLEVETHQAKAAFHLIEQARARLFLDQLGNARIDDIKQASPEVLSREGQLRGENIILEGQLGQELAKPGPELNSERIATLQSRLVAVRVSLIFVPQGVLHELPARQLGYNAAKTRMLVGQWRLDLVGLERRLQNELDEGPQIPSLEHGSKRSRGQN